jgi:hypothetical protein
VVVFVTVLALTWGCRYDVGAKEFKPVAAKEVCAFFFPSSAKLFFSVFHQINQVGPTTLAVRLLPQVTLPL